MKKKFLITVAILISSFGFAQQDSQFSNYMYNMVNFNPAYAGSRGMLSIFGMHRNQWVGVDGAPVTNSISISTPLEKSRLAIGLSLINDKIGVSDENSISVDVAYKIPVSKSVNLSLGLKGTGNFLNVDFTRLNGYTQGDQLAQFNIDNKFSPNLGLGFIINSEKSYFGYSIPNLLETKHFDKGQTTISSSSVATQRLHHFLVAGSVFDLGTDVKFKPAALMKIVKGAPLQADFSLNFLFNDKFTLGGAYRWGAALSTLAGFQVSNNWFIGYAYDREITKLAGFNRGSHEFFLRYELFKANGKSINQTRFF